MIWTLIGTLMVGVGAACVVFVAFRALRRPVPGWALPAAAGAGMLSFHIWSDYAWVDRNTAELPDHVVVAERYTSTRPRSAIIRRWTTWRWRPSIWSPAGTRRSPPGSSMIAPPRAAPISAPISRSTRTAGRSIPIGSPWHRTIRSAASSATLSTEGRTAQLEPRKVASMHREQHEWPARASSSSTTSPASASI